MAPRRKAPRRRAKRSFNISAIELGTALSLNQKSGFSTAVQTALGGDIAGAVNNLSSSSSKSSNEIICFRYISETGSIENKIIEEKK